MCVVGVEWAEMDVPQSFQNASCEKRARKSSVIHCQMTDFRSLIFTFIMGTFHINSPLTKDKALMMLLKCDI